MIATAPAIKRDAWCIRIVASKYSKIVRILIANFYTICVYKYALHSFRLHLATVGTVSVGKIYYLSSKSTRKSMFIGNGNKSEQMRECEMKMLSDFAIMSN